MDVAQKKQELLERIAESPATIVFARIDILNEVQLTDLLKAEFVSFLREQQILLIPILILCTKYVPTLLNKERCYKVQL